MNKSTENWEKKFDELFCNYTDPDYTDGSLLVAKNDNGSGRLHWQPGIIKFFISTLLADRDKEIVVMLKEMKAPISLLQDGATMDWARKESYEQALTDAINKINEK